MTISMVDTSHLSIFTNRNNMSEILDTKISAFNGTKDTEVIKKSEVSTVGQYLDRIKNGFYKEDIKKIRAGDSELKKELNTIAFHGIFEGYRKATNFVEASGLIILDIDDISPDDDIEEIKTDIMESCDHILAVMVSPSGDGIKLLYYVNKDLVTADNYRQIGKQLVENFDIYGKVDYLSVTDCLIATWDENILINESAIPAYIYIKETYVKKESNLEELDKSKTLWDDVEDFFDTVLAKDIESKTNNNFHYIQVAILDLAKFGFTHPKEDLSFVIHYAEEAFKRSPDNHKRFQEVVEIAKLYPQTQWAYKTTRDGNFDEEDDDYNDYSDYITKEPKKKAAKSKDDEEDDSEEVEGDGFVDYSDFFDKVLAVAKEGDRVGAEISLKSFSNIFRFKGTGILTVTGIPGSGKTEFVDQCILDLARLHGHETVIAGFEQTPEEHVIKLIKKAVGTNVTCPSYLNDSNMEEFKSAYDYITKVIKHINTTSVGGSINAILDAMAKYIKKRRDEGGDPRYVVIDPFNMLSVKGRFSGHEKIEEILRRITHFSHQMGVLVILIAHPFKMKKDEKTGMYEVPDFYSVKGSSAFFEMSYHGLVVYRTGYQTSDPVLIRVLKVKQSNLGVTAAEIYTSFDRNSGRYIPIDSDGDEESGDHRDKDWLKKISK